MRGLLDAGLVAATQTDLGQVEHPASAWDRFLGTFPPELAAEAEAIAILPPVAALARALDLLAGRPIALGDEASQS